MPALGGATHGAIASSMLAATNEATGPLRREAIRARGNPSDEGVPGRHRLARPRRRRRARVGRDEDARGVVPDPLARVIAVSTATLQDHAVASSPPCVAVGVDPEVSCGMSDGPSIVREDASMISERVHDRILPSARFGPATV